MGERDRENKREGFKVIWLLRAYIDWHNGSVTFYSIVHNGRYKIHMASHKLLLIP